MRPMVDPRDTKSILGAPFVPPPLLTRTLLATRRALSRAHRGSAPPSIQVLEGLFGLFDNRVLGLLVELDLPDLLDAPRSTDQLAESTGTAAPALDRLLSYAAGRGFLDKDRRGLWRANAVTELLRRDHPNSWRGWVEFAGSAWFWDAWRHADSPLRGKGSGVEAATGQTFFDYVNVVDPPAGAAFNRAMAAGATVQALALSKALDWSAISTVCDVGGGTGAALELLLRAQPHLEGVLIDLPEVVAAVNPVLAIGNLAGRCRIETGSFFDAVPAGADRYLMLAIIHDWDDERATTILANVRAQLGAHGRAVVVENVMPERPRGDFVEASDLLMLVLAAGQERTEAGFRALFARSGLTVESLVPLATGFVAFVLAAN